MSETQDYLPFEAETGRVLDLVINALYTNRDIFLRELISNAADACDKLRYAAIAAPDLLADDPALAITLKAEAAGKTLTVRDNGIGMNRQDLIDNLGTIARSGTARFLEQLGADHKKDAQLIGQFGVGFYAAFMVADRVTVLSRRAGETGGWRWESDGRSGYRLSEQPGLPRGTSVILHLKDDAEAYTEDHEIERIVRAYSDHVALPIRLDPGAVQETDADGNTVLTPQEPRQINQASALWQRPKSEITEAQYTEFYHHTAHAFDAPLRTIHYQAEGLLSYTALLFVPGSAPFDLYDPERRHRVKLYVKRVFIADALDGLLPRYLRFVAGVVDSQDLQLNVSRETLQHNAVVVKMRKGLTARVLSELAKLAKDAEAYAKFWSVFGAVLKEGLYEDREQAEKLLPLARFRSSTRDGWVSLDDYIAAMPEGQTALYYVTGENLEQLRHSPQLEACSAKGIEVLLLADAIDELWLPQAPDYQNKPFVSLTKGEVDLSAIKRDAADDDAETQDEAAPDTAALDRLIAGLNTALAGEIKEARVSKRLTESAVCLVAAEDAMDRRLERLLRQSMAERGQSAEGFPQNRPILEINPKHPLIAKMAERGAADDAAAGLAFADLARLLLDQARIVEGERLPDPAGFAKRLSAALAQGLL